MSSTALHPHPETGGDSLHPAFWHSISTPSHRAARDRLAGPLFPSMTGPEETRTLRPQVCLGTRVNEAA